MTRSVLLPALFALAAVTAASAAPVADPASVVMGFHRSVVAAAKAKSGEADAERAVRRSFDVDAIETAVLSDRPASAVQRSRLGDVIVRRLAARVLTDPDVRSGVELTVVRIRPSGDGGWLISTRSGPPTASLSLTWRLRQTTGGPRVVDVLHDGVSMASVERRKLEEALRGRDLDAALADIERRNAAKGR